MWSTPHQRIIQRRRLGDPRAAIASGLLVTIVLNSPGYLWPIPFVILWATYGWMRRRSRAQAGSGSLP